MIKNILRRNKLVYRTNIFLKSKLQERKAANELAYYQVEAVRTRIVQPEGKDLIQALRNRLKNRGIFPGFKKRGKLHIFLTYSVNSWETILPGVLKYYGKVSEFEWRSRGFDDRASNWLSQRDKMNDAMLTAFYKAHNEQSVDAIVGYLSGYNTNPLVLKKMGGGGAVIFNFCWDDKIGFRGKKFGGRWNGPAALASIVDLNLTNAPDSCVKYNVEGGLAMFWPEAADPDIHRPYDVPFEYDVSFVGQRYGWRPLFINRLRKMGICVTTFGPGWERASLPNEEMVEIYSRSRINLGFAGIGYSKKLMCLKGRDFEVPMSGGLYLTQDNPELSHVFDVGREILTYKDAGDCARIIKVLLADPQRADAIRKVGRERCLRDHTYEKRWDHIFKLAGIVE